MAFIDIHSHYAWNVDDGIETREDAQAALKKAQIQNITKISSNSSSYSRNNYKQKEVLVNKI